MAQAYRWWKCRPGTLTFVSLETRVLSSALLRFLIVSGVLCLRLPQPVAGQEYRLVRKRIPRPQGAFVLDSMALVFPRLRCLSDTGLRFSYSLRSGKLLLVQGRFSSDSAEFLYETYPFRFDRPYRAFSPELYDTLLSFADYPRFFKTQDRREELFALPGIRKAGVISRGIRLGNGQNGFVNSSLNLQLEGVLSPELHLTALISDQNIPFQPQGNTQQVRELDRILIQADHRLGQLQMGDVVLQNNPSSFLRYYKNVQGAQLTFSRDSSGRSRTRAGAGIAKGKFASVIVPVREGVQGPYRLRPPDNPDLLVVILANSERIYFDNRLLRRGFNRDYIIDYNTGELTLNNHLLVTRFTRLRCDFEYAERNYSRSILLAEQEERTGAFRYGIGFYQEQDNPSRPLSFTLDSLSRRILSEAGDDPRKALLPSFQVVTEFQEGLLYYNRRDTLIGAEVVSFFVLAGPGQAERYQVAFSETLPGRGDYELVENLGNGRWFRYAGPGKGRFLPIRQAVLPNRRAMTRAWTEWEAGSGHRLRGEAALSRYDRNRYSKAGDGDNGGDAQTIAWNWVKSDPGQVRVAELGLEYMRLSRRFSPVDRFRPIEFERDWNASSGDTLSADDHTLQTSLRFGRKDSWDLRQTGMLRDKGSNVRGFQQNTTFGHHAGKITGRHEWFTMRNSRAGEQAVWDRIVSSFRWGKGRLRPQYVFSLDQNAVRSAAGQVLRTAMHYRSHTVGLVSADTGENALALNYTYREDELPEGGRLQRQLFSHNAEVRAGTRIGMTQRLEATGTFRSLYNRASGRTEENVSARLDYRASFLDGAIRPELIYTANTGQEARRNIQYIRINALGEGTHQWLDYNGNGLQELEEFVEAQRPEDRQYIKVFTLTSELIPAYTQTMNFRLDASAPSSWHRGSRMKKILASFSWLSSLISDRRTQTGSLAERYLPLESARSLQVLSGNQVFRNTLFWNRTRSDLGAEYSQLSSLQKVWLSNGFSTRRVNEHRGLFRKNLGNWVNLVLQATLFERGVESDALVAQNYLIGGWEASPELAFQPHASHRISVQSGFSARENRLAGEQTRILRAGFDYRYTRAGSRSLNAAFRWNGISHIGAVQSPAAYEMLEGLLPGRNLTWNISLQQKLAQGLQLLLTYDGRKSEGSRVVHLGRMQANLLF